MAAPDFPRTDKLFRVHNGQLQNSLDRGKTWFQVASQVCGTQILLSPTFSDDGTAVAGNGSSICGVSHNGGYAWTSVDTHAMFGTYAYPDSATFVISPTHASDKRMYYAADFSGYPRHHSVILASPDSGQTWSERPLPDASVFVGGSGSLAVTGSASGRATLLLRARDPQRDPGTRYFRSLDLGRSWDEITEQFRNPSTGAIPQLSLVAGADADNVYALGSASAGSSGVWWSGDSGASWRQVSNAQTVLPTPDGCAVAGGQDLELLCGGQMTMRGVAPSVRGQSLRIWGVLATGDFGDHGTVLVNTDQGLFLVQMRP